ncbi:carboxymuconolactone decarboxylase family protein [Polaribacter sp. Hel1_85]|uniref:carboxymuconolactone decarboxylase family protein n=1 Tax=Polaribacter sp. Hel1_85 TaxID=1250005 RepID=UPI00052C938E|nr:carboxymuconolactone decarboxylase family protein [Polaribacter sp. Hel1_85]KGL63369.1 carboxymuconolactone decarboxylase family protein [Polaribacter sp. Hel1_85]
MKDYPKHYESIIKGMEEIGGKIPKTMAAFGEMHEKTIANGALSSKTKELIALGIAITVRCDGCIAFHVHDALESGASNEEIMETIGVAILMGGGPSVVYGCEAMEALEQFKVLA